MNRSFKRPSRFALAVLAALTTSCTSRSAVEEPVAPPQIYANMPLEEAIEAGIEFGDETLRDVKRLIKRRNQWSEMSTYLHERLVKDQLGLESARLINAMNLYMAAPLVKPIEVFRTLVRSERPLSRQLGWQLAELLTQEPMTRAIDEELTRAVEAGEESRVLMPELAIAVQNHRLGSAYTLMRLGLMTQGNEEYAKAMIAVGSEALPSDLMDYLALAPVEELRQLTLTSVNVFTCMTILRQLLVTPVSLSHQNANHLFLYAVSRNTALAELAQDVLLTYVPKEKDHLAFLLARHEPWVQIAYLENARRRMTPKLGLLLDELKRVTTQSDVVEEINSIPR